jgi:pentatricopeptide repeat protein
MKKDAIDLARRNDYPRGLESIRYLFSMFEQITDESSRDELVQVTEDAIRSFTNLAFSKPYRGQKARRRVDTGLEALQLQLSSGVLPAPYDEVPRQTFLVALRALSSIIATDANRKDLSTATSSISTDVAFRILQRLLTGIGVRNGSNGRQQPLSERDFNTVLNAVANVGRMDVAHKVVALQERTPRAPPLTAVTYSILLKGYGRLGDIENVEMILDKANKNGVEPDTVMLNSILDALVNCNQVKKAKSVFQKILAQTESASPNVRTYNTMLKGFAVDGALDEAKRLTKHMKEQNLWDFVTTNTLVNVAVKAYNFEFAEAVLMNHTQSVSADFALQHRGRKDHPNVEAYTMLLDGYAKSGDLDRALATLQRMRRIGVPPNEYTYTCMISALAKKRKIRQAVRLLDFMEESGTMPTTVTYNAFISALARVNKLASNNIHEDDDDGEEEDPWFVEQAIELLRRMVVKGVRPTATTVSILLECFATCSRPRIGEATAIVERFERNGLIPMNDAKVNTAMIRVYGAAKDIKGALEIFRCIEKPDIIAVNAFLDAACRTGEMKIAFDTFDHLFGSQPKSTTGDLTPDVITFSILISSQLRLNTVRAVKKAQDLYKDMRSRRVSPDVLLVDK